MKLNSYFSDGNALSGMLLKASDVKEGGINPIAMIQHVVGTPETKRLGFNLRITMLKFKCGDHTPDPLRLGR